MLSFSFETYQKRNANHLLSSRIQDVPTKRSKQSNFAPFVALLLMIPLYLLPTLTLGLLFPKFPRSIFFNFIFADFLALCLLALIEPEFTFPCQPIMHTLRTSIQSCLLRLLVLPLPRLLPPKEKRRGSLQFSRTKNLQNPPRVLFF